MSDPALIPVRLAYRLCSDTLYSAASRLRNRQGRPGRPTDAAKDAARKRNADLWERDSQRLGLISQQDGPLLQGEGVDAAVLGYLMAFLAGHADSFREIKAEMADLGVGVDLDPLKGDLVRLVKAVLSGC